MPAPETVAADGGVDASSTDCAEARVGAPSSPVARDATGCVLASPASRMPGRGCLPDISVAELFVHRASRLEFLAAALREVLAATQPQDPLAPQTVVVAHAGMGRWLRQFLALHPSRPRGVVANLELILPFEWLDRLERERLEPHRVSAPGWQREQLRWHIDAALSAFDDEPALAQVLLVQDSARQRFRLAERMASLFTQYLLYRRERVAAWEAGREDFWQARLWRALRRRMRGAHRGDTLAALLASLRAAEPSPRQRASPPHLLFGFNHFPPDHLELMDALSHRSPVHLFHPTPTFELWGDLATERAIAGIGNAAELHFDSGHPLLSALGGHGQSLALAIEARSGEAQVLDPLDLDEAPAQTRLGRLQESLRQLITEPDPPLHTTNARADASLRIHFCHTRLRELESVRDAILGRMIDDPELAPRDIVIMAPDVDAYARLLPAVFGDAAFATWLPYQCADRTASTHPVLARMERLLALDRYRFTVEDVLDLLAVPATARRFGATQSTPEAVARWARASGVAWGLDASDREGLSGHLHTLQFAIDRVTAGYLAGEDALDDQGQAGLAAWPGAPLPLADDGTNGADDLAALASLAARLGAWRNALRGAHPVAAWVRRVRQLLIEALFDPAPDDADAIAAIATLHAALTSVAQGAELAGRTDPVPFATVREALSGALATAGASQPFLGGGITVCGMVPARALPFRMVCVLGLNDGEFPRIDRGQGLDLMQAPGAWRRGDRNQREEDRYLFLEAILSARSYLHLSYRGEDPHSGEPLAPSAPLAELMSWLDAFDDASRPWWVVQPLQPFAVGAFDTHDRALSGFDARWCAAATATRAGPRTVVPFLAASAADAVRAARDFEPRPAHEAPVAPTERIVALEDLRRWLREPGRHFVHSTLGIAQPWLEQTVFEEPLDAELPRHTAALLGDALAKTWWRTGQLPETLPEHWLRTGLLPAGAAGAAAFDAARSVIAESVEKLAALQLDELIGADAIAVDVELDCAMHPAGARTRIAGRVDDFVPSAQVLRRVRFDTRRKIGDVLCALLDWAVLRLTSAPHARLLLWPPPKLAAAPRLGGWLEPATVCPERLGAFVAHLHQGYLDAQSHPLLLPARTGSVFLSAAAANDIAAAPVASAWRGEADRVGECDYAQWALLSRGSPLLDEEGRLSPQFLAAAGWARAAFAIVTDTPA